jgi:hypothetical protein
LGVGERLLKQSNGEVRLVYSLLDMIEMRAETLKKKMNGDLSMVNSGLE